MQDPATKEKRIQNLALSFFLGASAGNWCTTHQPTVEEPYLEITYLNPDGSPGLDSRGKPKGRPFKLLNAAARPHKKIRMTKFFAKCDCDLLVQKIKLHTLKPNIVPEDLVRVFNSCIAKAETLIKYRLATREVIYNKPTDPNKDLRKLLNKIAITTLGKTFKTRVERVSGGIVVKLFNGENIIAMTPTTIPSTFEVERVVINEMIKYIISNGSDLVITPK